MCFVFFPLLVSLENVLLDVKELQRGLDLTKREFTMHDHNTMLKEFIQTNEGKLKKLQDDAKIAQVFHSKLPSPLIRRRLLLSENPVTCETVFRHLEHFQAVLAGGNSPNWNTFLWAPTGLAAQ